MKPKLNKLLQEVRELYRPPGWRGLAKADGLYLLRLRSQLTLRRPARRVLNVPVLFNAAEQSHAQPVKITHL